MSDLMFQIRKATIDRKTGETEIKLSLDLDGTGPCPHRCALPRSYA